jgi:hypothetical protein
MLSIEHVPFARSQSCKYHVGRAEGLIEDAIKGERQIIKPNTKQLLALG